MKISEIINEDISATEQLGNESMTGNLLPVLMFLKNRSEDKELTPKLRTDSLIKLVKNAGDVMFNYDALIASYESNQSVKDLIKSFSEDEVILNSEFDKSSKSKFGDDYKQNKPDPATTIDQMAKRAAGKRS